MQTNIMSCRLVKESSVEYQPIRCLTDILQVINTIDNLTTGSEEYVYILCMNTRGYIVGIHEVSHGDLNNAFVSPQAIFVRAILNNASAIILIHSHPSGNPNPSEEDRQATDRIRKCGDLLGITLLDHVIVAGNRNYSFKANELI